MSTSHSVVHAGSTWEQQDWQDKCWQERSDSAAAATVGQDLLKQKRLFKAYKDFQQKQITHVNAAGRN